MAQRIRNDEIVEYVEDNISTFHDKRLERLKKLKLIDILKRKNPYLFKAKNIVTAQDLVKGILDAHLSSQEETIFGEFLEGLSIFICGKVYQGKKSSAEGIDLEFENRGTKYIVAIKSGPNWGNSSQIKKMIDNFKKAKRILCTNRGKTNVVAVNGCCYGQEKVVDKGDYLKLCGQEYWEFISGNPVLYTDIIEPLGHGAKVKNDEFSDSYGSLVNLFTKQFIQKFCGVNGSIDWVKLVEFNSAK